MAYAPQSQGPWLKGLVASNQPLAQPKGSFPRGSNLVLMERGALTPCDGSGIIDFFSGAVQNNRGRFMSEFLYEPTGVNPYYLVLAQGLDQHLGAPNLNSATGSVASGTLPAATYHYEITALDGVGGETVASNEKSATIAAPGHITLVWNVVPNAFGYNVYRTSGASGTEVLIGNIPGLPVIQPSPLTTTVTFIDDGSASVLSTTFTITSASVNGSVSMPSNQVFLTLVGGAIPSQYLHKPGTIAGNSVSYFNQTGTVFSNILPSITVFNATTQSHSRQTGTGGTLTVSASPPLVDTTQQTVLFQMPTGLITPISYSNANIVAYFPASLGQLGQVPTGGTGGSGTTGPGISGQGNSTPSGGVAGLVGPIPQMKQFTNRVCMAMGNGFALQLFWDSTGTLVNPAPSGSIASVAVTNDQVTVTVSAGVTISKTDPTQNGFMPVGSNVVLSGMTDTTYNGVFVVIAASAGSGGTFTIRNTAASGGASTGTFTVSTTTLISNFVPAYPVWTGSTAYAQGDIIVPATQPATPIYVTCLQAGTSAAPGSEPGWNSPQPTIGEQFKDNNIIWTVTALLNSAAPPPPGAGHIEIYAGSLWVFNTYPTDNFPPPPGTSNGLEGPTSLRMSNTNNPFGWNPVNQAFLDKDDGAEGMGLGKFTITALGIPPEGSLIAFKYRVPYQIIGVFGANNFAIQPVSSDMGCLAPRTIQFVSGYGLARYCHLGYAVFNGYKDEVISEQIRPYLFPVNDFDVQDITVADANYIPLSWAAQTANPPMYAVAIPIGNSGGQLTRIMLFDLILKCWAAPVDLPFPIGCMSQVQPVTSNPLTILGGFNDGCLQRWQAGDVNWYTGGGVAQAEVAWSVRTVTMASQNSSQRLWARKLMLRGTGSNVDTDPNIVINVVIRSSGIVQSSVKYTVSNQGDFDIDAAIGLTGLRFDAIISGNDHIEIDGWDWAVEPRPFGVVVSAV